jgi:prephenate dehydratase
MSGFFIKNFITMKKRVTIQGVAGCFHEAAAKKYFADKSIDIIPCETFHILFDKLKYDASLLGIIAIENTIAGSLLQNHELLRQSNLSIVGEQHLYISHVLCALPGQTIDQLTEVNSHPMALMQCEQYLLRHPNLKMVETSDTAGSAQYIAENQVKGHAAVCGRYAAELYGLNILDEDIQTNKRNFTRFLIVADPLEAEELTKNKTIDKASLVFTLPHTHGSLSKILTIFSFYDINLTKIQSMPIIGREWEYRFYIDVTFDNYMRYKQSIDAVRPLLNEFKILGEYKAYAKQ